MKSNELIVKKPGDLRDRKRTIPAQLEMLDFCSFLEGGSELVPRRKEDLSNLVDYWDQILKYCSSETEMAKLRSDDGRLPTKVVPFTLKNGAASVEAELRITPARIVDHTTGLELDVYPTVNEEIIEDILIYFASNEERSWLAGQGEGSQVWVRYTLYEIQKKLKKVRKTRSIREISRSIDILCKTILEVRTSSGRWTTMSILGTTTNCERFNGDDYQVTRLSDIVSAGIWARKYKQYPIAMYLAITSPIARYLFKKMFEQGNIGVDVPLKFDTDELERLNLITEGKPSQTRRTVDRALDEMKKRRVICWDDELPLECQAQKVGRRIVRYKYKIYPTNVMTTQIKASNLRVKNSRFVRQDNPIVKAMG